MLLSRPFGLALLGLASSVVAQSGGHPHIATEDAGFSLAALGLQSALFNQANGKWDFGEGFTAPGSSWDVGGVLSRDDPTLLDVTADVTTVTNWTSVGGGIQRYVGKLRCARFAVAEDEAGFEILMPDPNTIGGKASC